MATHAVTVWIAVGHSGDSAVAGCEEDAVESYRSTHDDIPRVVQVDLDVEVPEPTIVRASVPIGAGPVNLTAK